MANKVLVGKDDFVQIIKDVEDVSRYQEQRNKFFAENGADGYIYEPECCETVIRLLHLIFGEYDSNDEIARFCFNGNFGKKKSECKFKDEEGKETEIKSASQLYDYLLGIGG